VASALSRHPLWDREFVIRVSGAGKPTLTNRRHTFARGTTREPFLVDNQSVAAAAIRRQGQLVSEFPRVKRALACGSYELVHIHSRLSNGTAKH